MKQSKLNQSFIVKTLKNLDSKNDILIDSFMIGFSLGQSQENKSLNQQLDETSQAVIYLNNLKECGLVSPFHKQDIFMILMENKNLTIPQIVNQQKYEQLEGFNTIFQNPNNMEIDSLNLVKKLVLEEQDAVRQRLHEKEILNTKVNCPICMEVMKMDEVWPLTKCGHFFHRQCLNQYFQIQIDSREFTIRCPELKCKEPILDTDLQETLDDFQLQKYEQYMIKNYIDNHTQDMSWCPTPDCSYGFVYDNDEKELNCPLCLKRYCLLCKVEYHNGQTCKEYQVNKKFDANDEQFINFVKGKKFKQCPQCKFWVEKNEGCDHMTCRCSFQFCYICGGKYAQCECVNKRRGVNVPMRIGQQLLGNLIRKR